MQDTKKFAIYSRKSKFTGKGESIENQIELCKQYLKLHYDNVTEDNIAVFEDEGFSGGNTNRPQFKDMMKQCHNGTINIIVCYRLDRISRNIADFSKLIEEINELQVSFVSIKEQFDTSSSMGRAMMYIASVFSQLERETIAERIRDNMNELAKTGRWLGGNTPTGYQSLEVVGSVTVDGKVRKAFKLEAIEDELDLIKLIFNKFIEMNSLTKVETYLLQNHINTKNKNNFTRFSIKSILQNPVYMVADKASWTFFKQNNVEIYSGQEEFNGEYGVMAYNKTIQKSGKTNQMRDMAEWIISVGKHKAIISGEDWISVQKLLNQNKSKSYRKPKSNVALLSGLLFCGNCGDYMRPKLSSRLNANGEKIYSYLCETKEKSRCHNCDIKNSNGNTLDKMICEEIKKLSENSSDFMKQLRCVEKTIKTNTNEYDNRLEMLKKELIETETEIDQLVITLAKSNNSPAFKYITDKINELHNKKENIFNSINEIKNINQNNILSVYDFDVIRDLLQSFGSSFDTMSVEQKRTALRIFIKKIIWDGENVHVYLFGSEDETDNISIDTLDPNREDSKRNTNIAALNEIDNGKYALLSSQWNILCKSNEKLYLLIKYNTSSRIISPLFIHSFKFLKPHRLTESEKFNIQYTNPNEILTTAEKLRYFRYEKSLLQRDVADYAGIDRSTYICYENVEHDFYPIDKLLKIAELFEIDVIELLDDYNTFLYNGQGKQIQKWRKGQGLTQNEFGKKIDVHGGTVKRWESEKVKVCKQTWERLREYRISN